MEQPAAEPDRTSSEQAERAAVLAAIAEIAGEQDVGAATVAQISKRAGLTRHRFYELFGNRDRCLDESYDAVVAQVDTRVRAACAEGRSWTERMRCGLRAALACFDEDPALAKLCVLHALGAAPATIRRRRRVFVELVRAVEAGGSAAGAAPSPYIAEGIVGGAFALIETRLAADPPPSLAELVNPIMWMIVLPYLGPGAAARELARAAPADGEEGGEASAAPAPAALDPRVLARESDGRAAALLRARPTRLRRARGGEHARNR
jgi:AcrR family transcriptional regulator